MAYIVKAPSVIRALSETPGRGMRLFLKMALGVLTVFIAMSFQSAASAQTDKCAGKTGEFLQRCQAMHAEADARAAANRAAREAARGAAGEPAWQRSAPPLGSRSMAASSRSALQTGGAYAESPTIDRTVKPAMLTFVVHPSYSRRPGRLRLPITHGCNGSSADEELTFNKACRVELMQGQTLALPLFQQSCEEGDPGGCFMYADHIASSRPTEALAMYDTLCNIGHPNACYRVALAYEEGTGVAKNAAMQRAYYDRACAAGNAYGCSFVAGKVDADCPHGHRGWRADVDRKIYKVVCVVDTGPLTTSEHEIPPLPGEMEAIKNMASQANTSIPKWWIDALDAKPYDPGCIRNDLHDSEGRPIAGSGCIGVNH
jgi:TPR repeat protein